MPSRTTTRDDPKKKKTSTQANVKSPDSSKVSAVGPKTSVVPRMLRKNEAQQSQRDAQGMEDVQAKIALKAHELHEQRGRLHGNDLDDWLEAERHVLGEKSRS